MTTDALGVMAMDNKEGRDVESSRHRAPSLIIAGLLVAACGLIAFEIPGYRLTVGGEPGPAAFPRLIAVLCLTAALILVIQTLRGAYDTHGLEGRAASWRLLLGMVTLVAATLALESIGFFLTFTTMLFVVGMLIGARRWWTSLLLAAVSSWLVLVVFGRLFSVPLPASFVDIALGG